MPSLIRRTPPDSSAGFKCCYRFSWIHLLIFLFSIARSNPRLLAATWTSADTTGQPFVANFFSTAGSSPQTGVLVLGGSEGGRPDGLARIFAGKGYPVLSLAYFNTPGTPESLDMIPLEYFTPALKWLSANPKVKNGEIVAVGGSKGAELALLLASRDSRIHGVIAIAPSSVVWQGLPKIFWPPRSSWTANGNPVPYLPYDYSQGVDTNNLLAMYKLSLAQESAVKSATIEVEKINGPLLLLCGTDDKLWPSPAMADAISSRLKEKGFKNHCDVIKYPDAGHTLNENFMLGGTAEGNKKARIDSTEKMLGFLHAIDAGTKSP